MRYLKLSVVMLLVVMLAMPCFAQITPNGVPLLIKYNGNLSKANGSPYPTGMYDINFYICDDADCINVLWSESHTIEISNRDKKDIDGGTSYEAAFSVVLGSENALNLLFDKDYYLHITESIGSYDKIEQLLSTPYCLRGEFANYADTAYDSNDGKYKDVKAIKVANAFQADNSDTVDNIHAYLTIGDIPEGEDGLVAYTAISTEVDNRISNHASETTGIHGVTGDIVGTTDTQTLANKTVTDSTITDSTITNSQIQKRVTGTCAAGSSIRVINSDGSVTCETDDAPLNVQCPSGQMVIGFDGSGSLLCKDAPTGFGIFQIIHGQDWAKIVGPDGRQELIVRPDSPPLTICSQNGNCFSYNIGSGAYNGNEQIYEYNAIVAGIVAIGAGRGISVTSNYRDSIGKIETFAWTTVSFKNSAWGN